MLQRHSAYGQNRPDCSQLSHNPSLLRCAEARNNVEINIAKTAKTADRRGPHPATHLVARVLGKNIETSNGEAKFVGVGELADAGTQGHQFVTCNLQPNTRGLIVHDMTAEARERYRMKQTLKPERGLVF